MPLRPYHSLTKIHKILTSRTIFPLPTFCKDENELSHLRLILLYCYMKEENEENPLETYILTPEENEILFSQSITHLSQLYYDFQSENRYTYALKRLSFLAEQGFNANKNKLAKDSIWNYNMFWNGLFRLLTTMIERSKMKYKFSEQRLKDNLDTVNATIKYCKDTEDLPPESALNYVNFLIEATKQEISSVSKTDLLFPPDVSNILDLFPIHFFMKATKPSQKVFLKGKTVISFPGRTESLINAVNDINQNGYNGSIKNVHGLYYPEIETVFIIDGHHHTAVTKSFPEDAYVTADEYSLKEAVQTVDFIGDRWINKAEPDKDKPVPILDMRYALLYRLIQKRFELEDNIKQNDDIKKTRLNV